MIGLLVQKRSSVPVYGRVIGPSRCFPCDGEQCYHIVYEDGEEAVMPESEVRLWASAQGHNLAPGVRTQGSLSSSMVDPAFQRMPLRARPEHSPFFGPVSAGPCPPPRTYVSNSGRHFDWNSARSFSHYPQCSLVAGGPTRPQNFCEWLVDGLFTVLCALAVAFIMLKAAECLDFKFAYLKDTEWWQDIFANSSSFAADFVSGASWVTMTLHSAFKTIVNEILSSSWSSDLPVTARIEGDFGSSGMAAAWAAANFKVP